MKKLLGIVVLGLLLSGNAFAETNSKRLSLNSAISELEICDKTLSTNSYLQIFLIKYGSCFVLFLEETSLS